MTTCPKCNAENRPEAAFCARCGTILFAQPSTSKNAVVIETPPAAPQEFENISTPISSPEITTPQPVAQKTAPKLEIIVGLPSRSEGSTFGDRFQYDALLHQDLHENLYTVTESCQPGNPCIRICSNPDCMTIHVPTGSEVENFCTVCGSHLDEQGPLLLLKESDQNKYTTLQPLIDMHLTHPNIHPPLTVFTEELAGRFRYDLVNPFSQKLPENPSLNQAMNWGTRLATALDYLHLHGIVLGEGIDSSSIGLVIDKVVWRNFDTARILPMLTDRDKINDLRLLVLNMYTWITGKTTYDVDPYLPPALNELFQTALVGVGFTSGSELINQIDLVKSAGLSRLALDYQVGRRTNTGKIRSQNEDSILSYEISQVRQGSLHPLGLFGVADGMGGHTTGEVASSLVISTILDKASADLLKLQEKPAGDYLSWLKKVLDIANQAVYAARQKAGTDMGSTLAMVLMVDDHAFLSNLGDSRIYKITGTSIEQLTTDHSIVQHMVSTGEIKPEEARNHPQRNVIYRSMGDKPQAEADFSSQSLLPGDQFLLCSDGLNNMLDDQTIHKIILGSTSPQNACDKLVEAANQAGGDDNISVILVKIISTPV